MCFVCVENNYFGLHARFHETDANELVALIKPFPIGHELKVIGRVTSEAVRSFEGTGEIILPDGQIAVSAEDKYLKADIEKIAEDTLENDDWFIVNRPDDPSEIEIP